MTPLLREAVAAIEPRVVDWRRRIHQLPELAFQEKSTAAFVEEQLRTLDLDVVRPGLGTTGVAALLRGAASPSTNRPIVLLRADMDALPIAEQTNLGFASTNAGVMHACGHDAHTAILLGVAHVLCRLRGQLSTDVLFMFQPAEEAGLGARRMLDDGLFKMARPEVAYMLHVWHDLQAGILAIPTGAVMAGALMFEIIVSGRGGHAARPQLALDPVVTSAHIVAMLQTVVSREMDPAQPVVLTIGSIQAGEAPNVIPDSARIVGTARAYDRDILQVVQRRIEEVATKTAAALRLSATVRFGAAIPPVVNDDAAVSHAVDAIRNELGSDAIGTVGPSMGSEDFAYVLDETPGAMIRLGVRSPLWSEARPIHTAIFDLDERALRLGVIALSAIALRYERQAVRQDLSGSDP